MMGLFFVEAKRGGVRIEEYNIRNAPDVLPRTLISRWDTLTALPNEHHARLQYAWWVFEVVKATVLRVQIQSSQGWKARRVYSSYALPFMIFQNAHQPLPLQSSPWCFYMLIPPESQKKLLEDPVSESFCDTSRHQPLVVLVRRDGKGSVHLENGAVVCLFGQDGVPVASRSSDIESDTVSHYSSGYLFPSKPDAHASSLNDAGFNTITVDKVIALSREIFALTYALELKADSTVENAVQRRLRTLTVSTPAHWDRQLEKIHREETAKAFPVSHVLDTPS